MSKLPFGLSSFEVTQKTSATPEQIENYRSEQDHNKRIDMVYMYYIPWEHLYPDDLKEIQNDMYCDEQDLDDCRGITCMTDM